MLLTDYRRRPAFTTKVTPVTKPRSPAFYGLNHVDKGFGCDWHERLVIESSSYQQTIKEMKK
jgi:hypothetical protein